MKRIETLTSIDRRALMHTLNDAAFKGEAAFICDSILNSDGYESIKTFRGWLAWLCDDVKGEKISSGYRVLYTSRINQYHIVRPDGENLYANGKPWALLPIDLDRRWDFIITDVFSNRYGAACILVEDTYTCEMWLYSDMVKGGKA